MALVGGKTVGYREFNADFPWMVAVVQTTDGSLCGGVLISPTWVLTAAHCTNNKRIVKLGNVRNSDARRVEVLQAIRHPAFDSATYENDVGLLQLSEAVDISPVPLIDGADEYDWLKSDSGGLILGWGRLPSGRIPAELMKAVVSVKSVTIVANYLGISGKTGPCHRDSGGPLLAPVSGENSAGVVTTVDWQLAGIMSVTGGNLCAQGGGVAFYARVIAMNDFIREYVADLPE